MRISIWPGSSQPFDETLAVARHAAETGWDGVWFADHFMSNHEPGEDPYTPVLEAGSVVAALAAAVPRVRVGTLVYSVTYRHPAVLANMAATVDRISGGRFTLGVGAGWQINEHEQYGLDLSTIKRRLDRFVEALEVMRGLLREPVTTFEGEYFQLRDAVCEPKPVQEPLPILIGGAGEKRMLKIVAQYADQWNCWGDPDRIAHKSRVLDDFCASVGRDPKTLYRTAQAHTILDGPLPDVPERVIGGSPAKLAEAFDRYRELGVDELIVPDWHFGTGDARLSAMDAVLKISQT